VNRSPGNPSQPYDAVVIGGGHNGLVAAAYLARAGQQTLVLERSEVLGGTAVTEELCPGFKVDTGAHLIGALHRGVLADLGLERNGLRVVRADPTVFAPHPDGRALLLARDAAASAQSIRTFSATDAERWGEFVERMTGAASVLETVHDLTPPRVTRSEARDLRDFLRMGKLVRRHGRKELVELLRLLPMSVVELVEEWFESDALKAAVCASGITGMFQGPMASGTAHRMLHSLVGAGGVIRPTCWIMGGTGELARVLAEAGGRHGAQIRTGAGVERILVEDGKTVGVLLENGETIPSRLVVSSADPGRTLLGLVDPLDLDPVFLSKVRNIKYRGACAKVNLALGELPNFSSAPGDGPHLRAAISIGPDVEYLERAYDDAKYGSFSNQPYLEAFIPSLWDPSLAPEGSHVMSVLMQYAPYHLRDGAWDSAKREALGDTVVATLARYAPNLENAIIDRQVLTPADLEKRFGLTEGHIHHGDLTLDQTFLMRPVPGWSRYRTPIGGLYLCGAGTHPGGGITGASGHNAAREILKDVKRG
jgi:phytoene dehydrogenase-like protein